MDISENLERRVRDLRKRLANKAAPQQRSPLGIRQTPHTPRPETKLLTRKAGGLTQEERERAQRAIDFGRRALKGVVIPPPPKIDERTVGRKIADFGADILRGTPRAAASLTLKALGGERIVPETPAEKFLFGREPIYTPEEEGKKLLRGFGTDEEAARAHGGILGYPLAVLGAMPILGGKVRLVKQLAKEGTRGGTRQILQRNIKGLSKKEVDDLARRFAPIKDERVIQRELDTFMKARPRAVPAGAGKVPEIKAVKGRVAKGVDPFKRRERGFLSRVKKITPELETRVAGQYVPRSTDRLAIKARNLIGDDIMLAERVLAKKIARREVDDKMVAVGAELMSHYNALAAAAKTKSIREGFFQKAADVANELAPELTRAGRTVQAAAIYGRLTPEGILRFSARQIQKYNEEIEGVPPLVRRLQGLPDKIPPLTGKQVEKLMEEARRVKAMPDGEEKALAWQALHREIAKLTPTPLMNKVISVWKAGLLTGIKTSGLNIASNLFHGVSEIIKDIPAAGFDIAMSLITGQRTVAFTLRGLGRGATEGFGKGWRYFRTGLDERDVGAKLDYRIINFGDSPAARAIQAYEQTIFRFIGAQDQVFYYGAKARAIQSQAIAQAMNKKLRGGAAKRFIDDLVANPTDDILKNAADDAETAVFQHITELGRLGGKIQRLGGGAGEVVVPFAKTPAAVAMQILNYSPVGIVAGLGKAILHYKDLAKVQRQVAHALGRGVTGTAVLGLGAWLYGKGRVSLGFPKDERERNRWELEGIEANSIKIGNKWRRAHILGPAGLMIIWGGYVRNLYEDTGSATAAARATEAAVGSVAGMAKTFTEQTFVRGIESALGLITDPERNWQRAASVLAGPLGPSVIPTIVSDVARATDPYQRAVGRIETPLDITPFSERGMARIPGLRQRLEPRIDVAGQPVETPGSPLEIMIDPTRPVEAKTSPTIAELARLSAAGHRVIPTDLGDKHGYRSLTPEQNTWIRQDAGQRLFRALDELFASEHYQKASDEDRAGIIEDFTRKARAGARARLLKEVLYGSGAPQGEALAAKIEELQADGVLTQDVRRRLLELLGNEQ